MSSSVRPTTVMTTTEGGAGCRQGYYKCQDNKCIRESSICDKRRDCDSGEDELNCGELICSMQCLVSQLYPVMEVRARLDYLHSSYVSGVIH